jgi:YD repeat-containing protein
MADAVSSPFGIGLQNYTSSYANYSSPTASPTASPTLYDKNENPIAPAPLTTASPTQYDEDGNPVVPTSEATPSATEYDEDGNLIAPVTEATPASTQYHGDGNPIILAFGAGSGASACVFGGLAASETSSESFYDIPASTTSDFDSAPLPYRCYYYFRRIQLHWSW